MYLHNRMEDSAQRWRRFCRPGWRMAGISLAIWVALWLVVIRLAPLTPASLRVSPPTTSWLPATAPAVAHHQTLWTPAAFALPTPAGFTHHLRRQHARIAPPEKSAESRLTHLQPTRSPTTDQPVPWKMPAAPLAGAPTPALSAGEVFPPRVLPAETPRMEFSEGWESRLISGIDLDYPAWTNIAWTAHVEVQFDATGVPISVLLAQPTGQSELDARLVRSVRAWRLLEPAVTRQGSVTWMHPLTLAEPNNLNEPATP